MKGYRGIAITGVIMVASLFAMGFIFMDLSQKLQYENQRVWPVLTNKYDNLEYQGNGMKNGKLLFVSGEYAPYIYMENDIVKGSSYEQLKRVLEKMKVPYEIEVVSWSRGLYMLDTGEAFATFPYAKSSKREAQYLFSDAFDRSELKQNFVYGFQQPGKNKLRLDTLEDLKSLRVGGVYGYYYLERFKNLGLKIDLSVNEQECLAKLKDDKIDVAVFDPNVAKYLIDTYFKDGGDRFYQTDLAVNPEQAGDFLMMDRDNPKAQDFIETFNQINQSFK